jgi:hypothetical protein
MHMQFINSLFPLLHSRLSQSNFTVHVHTQDIAWEQVKKFCSIRTDLCCMFSFLLLIIMSDKSYTHHQGPFGRTMYMYNIYNS